MKKFHHFVQQQNGQVIFAFQGQDIATFLDDIHHKSTLADTAVPAGISVAAVAKIKAHLVSPEVRYSLQTLDGTAYRRVLVHLLQPVNLPQVNSEQSGGVPEKKKKKHKQKHHFFRVNPFRPALFGGQLTWD